MIVWCLLAEESTAVSGPVAVLVPASVSSVWSGEATKAVRTSKARWRSIAIRSSKTATELVAIAAVVAFMPSIIATVAIVVVRAESSTDQTHTDTDASEAEVPFVAVRFRIIRQLTSRRLWIYFVVYRFQACCWHRNTSGSRVLDWHC